jgi:hypothetical protein
MERMKKCKKDKRVDQIGEKEGERWKRIRMYVKRVDEIGEKE